MASRIPSRDQTAASRISNNTVNATVSQDQEPDVDYSRVSLMSTYSTNSRDSGYATASMGSSSSRPGSWASRQQLFRPRRSILRRRCSATLSTGPPNNDGHVHDHDHDHDHDHNDNHDHESKLELEHEHEHEHNPDHGCSSDSDIKSDARPRRSLKCSTCGMRMQTKGLLTRHEARHRRKFMCHVEGCSRNTGFATVNDLNRHMKAVHGFNIPGSRDYMCFAPGCTKADKKWPRLDNFKAHITRMHPGADVDDLVRESIDWFTQEQVEDARVSIAQLSAMQKEDSPDSVHADSMYMSAVQKDIDMFPLGRPFVSKVQRSKDDENPWDSGIHISDHVFDGQFQESCFEATASSSHDAVPAYPTKPMLFTYENLHPWNIDQTRRQYVQSRLIKCPNLFEEDPVAKNLGFTTSSTDLTYGLKHRNGVWETPDITIQPPTRVGTPQTLPGRGFDSDEEHESLITSSHSADWSRSTPTSFDSIHVDSSSDGQPSMSSSATMPSPNTTNVIGETSKADTDEKDSLTWSTSASKGSFSPLPTSASQLANDEPPNITRMRMAVAQLSSGQTGTTLVGDFLCQSPSDAADQPPSKRTKVSEKNYSQAGSSSKPNQKGKQVDRNNDGNDDEEEQEDGRRRKKPATKEDASERAKKIFACPICKYHPVFFAKCHPVVLTIDALYRHHIMVEHVRWGHISDDTVKRLRALGDERRSAIERWRAMYQCIFRIPVGSEDLIPSPFWLPLLSSSNVDTLVAAAILVTGSQNHVRDLDQDSITDSDPLLTLNDAFKKIDSLMDECEENEKAQAKQRWSLVREHSRFALYTGRLPNLLTLNMASMMPLTGHWTGVGEVGNRSVGVQHPTLQGVNGTLAASPSTFIDPTVKEEANVQIQNNAEYPQVVDLPNINHEDVERGGDPALIPAAVAIGAHDFDKLHQHPTQEVSQPDSGYVSLNPCQQFIPDIEYEYMCWLCKKPIFDHSIEVQQKHDELNQMDLSENSLSWMDKI